MLEIGECEVSKILCLFDLLGAVQMHKETASINERILAVPVRSPCKIGQSFKAANPYIPIA